jgi:hypothetical protein
LEQHPVGTIGADVGFKLASDPEERTATTFRPGFPPVALASPNDVLDLSDAITGFRCSLNDIFQ